MSGMLNDSFWKVFTKESVTERTHLVKQKEFDVRYYSE